ncbi:hypothetical protein KFK09_028442 [Dendrobium nobile]|uniref:Uncharacterized protein n=1 Tax=Dendrobium nobile TaxID=94219 RepID=A0A8T3A7I9_DENNO|nr:hypothetical protein KFK09_028442 [Dendrobium nobile]
MRMFRSIKTLLKKVSMPATKQIAQNNPIYAGNIIISRYVYKNPSIQILEIKIQHNIRINNNTIIELPTRAGRKTRTKENIIHHTIQDERTDTQKTRPPK